MPMPHTLRLALMALLCLAVTGGLLWLWLDWVGLPIGALGRSFAATLATLLGISVVAWAGKALGFGRDEGKGGDNPL